MKSAQMESLQVVPENTLEMTVRQSGSSCEDIERMLKKKSIHDFNFEKNAILIDERCKRIGFDRLVAHPRILQVWSYAKYALGSYYEAINFSHALTKLLNPQEDRATLIDQHILLAKAFLALTDQTQAWRHHKISQQLSLNEAKTIEEPHRLYEISLLKIRLLIAQGSLEQANVVIQQDAEHCKDAHMLIMYRIFAFLIRMHSKELTDDAIADFSDVETIDPYQPGLSLQLRHNYLFARLVFAHALIHCGQPLRAQQLLPLGSYPRFLKPHTLFVQAEIALYEGNFSYASKLLTEALGSKGSGLSRSELQGIFWLRALVSLGLESKEAFEMHTCRLKDSLKGSHCIRWKQRSYLFSALAAGLNKDFRKMKMCLHESDSTGRILGQNNELLDFLARGLCAYNNGAFEEFATAQRELQHDALLFRSNFLYGKVLSQAQPLFFEMILKREGVENVPASFYSKSYVGALIEAREFRLLDAQESADLKKRYRAIYHEESSNKAQQKIGITLFGALGVEVDGEFYSLSSWRKSKARELFIALATSAGRDISRDELLERFWPNKDERSARNCFYVTWSNMKKHLSQVHPNFASLIPSQSSGSRNFLCTDICTIDLFNFSRHITMARRAEIHGQHQEALHHFSLGAQLYSGDLLPGDTTIEWLDPLREYHHTMFVEAMITATDLSIECGDFNRAIFFIESALGVERGREVLYERAMQVYVKASRREDAIRSYLACKKYLNEELGLDPSERLQQLYVETLKG